MYLYASEISKLPSPCKKMHIQNDGEIVHWAKPRVPPKSHILSNHWHRKMFLNTIKQQLKSTKHTGLAIKNRHLFGVL